jgi:acetylornithine aminotransferase
VVVKCMQKGFLINCIQDNILRFIPPLIISKNEIDELIECLDTFLTEAASSGQ